MGAKDAGYRLHEKRPTHLRSTPSICPGYLDQVTLLVYITYFRSFFAGFAVVRNDTN